MKNETLINHLHDAFLHCGEILPAADVARKTRELEFDLGVEFDAQTVLVSVREAGERFVDSMVQNEHDNVRVAEWERVRPSTLRQEQLEKLLTIP